MICRELRFLIWREPWPFLLLQPCLGREVDMALTDLNAFIAFGPENINYLTGHDTPAYQYLQACVVTHEGPPVNLLRSIDASNTLLAPGHGARLPMPIMTTRRRC